MRSSFLLATSALLLAASTASAARIKVSKGGPIPTIQEGVDLAQPGDTVLIGPGVYSESISVPATKTGIRIRGRGSVVLDGVAATRAGTYQLLQISAGGVQVRGLILRNLNTEYGDAVKISASDVLLEDLRIRGCAGGITAIGSGVRVEDCALSGCGVTIIGDDASAFRTEIRNASNPGFYLNGRRSQVRKCTVTGVANINGSWSRGIYTPDDDAVVVGNEVRNIAGSGIYVPGDRALVKKNSIENANWDGIYVPGEGAVVDRNTIRNCGKNGINVIGAGARVTGNDVRGARTLMSVIGDSGIVSDNVLQDGVAWLDSSNDTTIFSHGLYLSGQGVSADGNLIQDVPGHGIMLFGSGSTLTGNEVRRAGIGEDGLFIYHGVLIRGSNQTLVDNRVRNCTGDAFYVDGSTIRLERNRALDNLRDGFDVSAGASDVTLIRNQARRNGAEGLDHSAPGFNLINDNTFLDNRLDVGSDGNVVQFERNTFVTGGVGETPELD